MGGSSKTKGDQTNIDRNKFLKSVGLPNDLQTLSLYRPSGKILKFAKFRVVFWLPSWIFLLPLRHPYTECFFQTNDDVSVFPKSASPSNNLQTCFYLVRMQKY